MNQITEQIELELSNSQDLCLNSKGCNGSFIYYYCSFLSVLIPLHSSGLFHVISPSLLYFLPFLLPALSFINPPCIYPSFFPSVFAIGDGLSARYSWTTNFLRYVPVAETQTQTHSQLITEPVRHNSTSLSLPSCTTDTHK